MQGVLGGGHAVNVHGLDVSFKEGIVLDGSVCGSGSGVDMRVGRNLRVLRVPGSGP